jgi:hypothetical protein
MFDPSAPSAPLTQERIAARRRMSPGEMWVIAKFERRMQRPLTPQEEDYALADAKALGML